MEERTIYLLGDSIKSSLSETVANNSLTVDRNLLELFDLKNLYSRQIRPKLQTTTNNGSSNSYSVITLPEESFESYIKNLPGNNTPVSDDTLSNLAAHQEQKDSASSLITKPHQLILFDDATLQRAFSLKESTIPIPNLDKSWLGIQEPQIIKLSATKTTPSPSSLLQPVVSTIHAPRSSGTPGPTPSMKIRIRRPIPSPMNNKVTAITTEKGSSSSPLHGLGDEGTKKAKRSHHDLLDGASASSETKKTKLS